MVDTIYEVSGIGLTLNGHNGERDSYFTDGEIKISRLVEGCDKRIESTAVIASPPLVQLKGVALRIIGQMLLSDEEADFVEVPK